MVDDEEGREDSEERDDRWRGDEGFVSAELPWCRSMFANGSMGKSGHIPPGASIRIPSTVGDAGATKGGGSTLCHSLGFGKPRQWERILCKTRM